MCSETDMDKKLELKDEMRAEYLESEKVSLKSIARKFGVSYPTLLKLAKQEGWRELRKSGNPKNDELNGGGLPERDNSGGNTSQNRECNSFSQEQPEKQEITELRKQAYKLATNAAKALHLKEDWNPKEFDLMVGTYVKIVGAQVKLEGDSDGIDRLIGELTATDVILSHSCDNQENGDES